MSRGPEVTADLRERIKRDLGNDFEALAGWCSCDRCDQGLDAIEALVRAYAAEQLREAAAEARDTDTQIRQFGRDLQHRADAIEKGEK